MEEIFMKEAIKEAKKAYKKKEENQAKLKKFIKKY